MLPQVLHARPLLNPTQYDVPVFLLGAMPVGAVAHVDRGYENVNTRTPRGCNVRVSHGRISYIDRHILGDSLLSLNLRDISLVIFREENVVMRFIRVDLI